MFNGVFSSVFNVDASLQAFASDLHTSDISSNDDFIQYPDQADNQTYQNTTLNNKSISIPFANQETETKQGIDSTFIDVNSIQQSGTLAGGEQAQLVATSQGLLSEEFPQPEMDRPWFCSVYALAGYHFCDPITNVPKWCQYDITDIWCPDDPGFEYDGATGQGGSSGGAGAGRTWDSNKCMDSDYKSIPCGNLSVDKLCSAYYYESGFKIGETNTSKLQFIPCNDYYSCVNDFGEVVNCNWGTNFSYPTLILPNGKCYDNYRNSPGWLGNVVPCVAKIKYVVPPIDDSRITLDPTLKLIVYETGMPVNNEKIEDGYPLPLPPPVPDSDPFNPEYPETTDECASIVCQCISFVVKALEKVDNSILQVVAAVQDLSFDIPAPSPFDISPVTDRLDDILSAIDDISIEMVKEAETNIWDFLGETISTLNDLIQYLIDQIIYLIVPEDTDFLRENFSMLREAMSMKLEPVNMLKTQITASLMTEQQNFEDIHMNLPIYGRVKFLDVEFLNYAVPKIRALISGIMIIVTSVWAYRKITSDMVR